jgi:outer membrane receptor for ferrienterochelin and colicin
MSFRKRPLTVPRFRFATAIIPAILASTGAAQAQQADAPAAKVDVHGSAANYDPRRDDTATKIVVRHDEIVKYGDTNVLDVLKRLPGVTVSGTPGRGAEIRMRGLGSGYTQVLVNGERPGPGFSVDALSPDVIERIEVLRAATAEYSTQSIAGTINIVLKKVARKDERNFKAGYARGPGTHNPNASLELSDKSDKFSYSIAAAAMRNNFSGEVPSLEEERGPDGQLTALRTTAAHEDGQFRALSLVPRLNWTLEGGDTLTSESTFSANRMAVGVHLPTVTESGALPPYPDQSVAMSGHRAFARTGLDWVHKLAGGASMNMKLAATVQNGGDASHRDERGNPAFDPMANQMDSHFRARGLSSTGKYTVPIWEGHAFALGWDGGYDKRFEERRERAYLNGTTIVPYADEDSAGTVMRAAVFAQDEWNVTPRWSLYVGARWEGMRLRAEGKTFDTAHASFSVLSPVMQTLYKLPTQSDQLRLAVTRTYNAVGVQQLVSHLISINNSQAEPDVVGNPNLKPELALGVDAAYEHFWGQGAMVSVSAASRSIDDYTRYLVFFDGSRWISRATNIGKARTHSLELEAKFPLKKLYAAAPAVDVRANVARNWSQVDSVPGPDNRLDRQTPLSANLGLDYSGGALSAGGSYSFKSAGTTREAANRTRYDNAQRNLDLYALWKLSRRYQLRLAAANVLGQDRIVESRYISADGEMHNRSGNVAYASVRATLEAKF